MNRRSFSLVVAALALVALVAAAVPALGDEAVAPRFDRPASAAALAKAKRALGFSRQARRVARQAGNAAANARARANAANALGEENRSQLASAQEALKKDGSRIDALEAQVKALAEQGSGGGKVVSASAAGTVESSAVFGEYEALGGPSLQVTVPPSGLIEVWAQVEINDDEGGAVGLFEDGQRVTGISAQGLCGDPSGIDDGSALIDMQGVGGGEFVAFSTPPTPNISLGCANAGAPAPVLLSRPSGPHTYELRYSECSCNPGSGAEFRNRTLRVAPRP